MDRIWSSKLGAHVLHWVLATGMLSEKAVVSGIVLFTIVLSPRDRAKDIDKPWRPHDLQQSVSSTENLASSAVIVSHQRARTATTVTFPGSELTLAIISYGAAPGATRPQSRLLFLQSREQAGTQW